MNKKQLEKHMLTLYRGLGSILALMKEADLKKIDVKPLIDGIGNIITELDYMKKHIKSLPET
jgi:hypothetical protein